MRETDLIREQWRQATTQQIRYEIARVQHARTVAARRREIDRYDVRESILRALLSERHQRAD